MSLRDAIKDKLDKAEKHRFVVLLLSGKLPINAYIDHVSNQLFCYEALENRVEEFGLFDGIEDIRRVESIKIDLSELGEPGVIFQSSKDYASYIKSVSAEKLWAHIYARHFADMYGGQMIKKVAPGSGRMYEFNDRSFLISKVREKLSDDLAEEANLVFDFSLRLFDELANVHNLSAA